MTSEVYRWQAAMGAVAGALVAGSLSQTSGEWTAAGLRSIDHAESFLAGNPLPLDLPPHEAVPAAIGLASGPAPLLMNSTTVALIDVVRNALETGQSSEPSDPLLLDAVASGGTRSFVTAVEYAGADEDRATLVGALIGLDGGLGAVPAELVSTIGAPDGRRGRRYLCALTNRMLGIERPNWYDPRNRRGPKQVLPGLWLSNLFGVSRFVTEHPDGLVLSLCDDEGQVGGHRPHVTFHLDDTPRTDANPSLDTVIDEVLETIANARSAGQPVLLHCRHGASRTGLILRLMLVDELGLSAEDALTEAQALWSHTSSWNKDWNREVERRASS